VGSLTSMKPENPLSDARNHRINELLGFTPSFFTQLETGFLEFIKTNANSPKAEFYIPGMVNSLLKRKEVSVRILPCSDQWFGMTYREDRELVVSKIGELVNAGIYPANLWN